jgi:hypothetical protein
MLLGGLPLRHFFDRRGLPLVVHHALFGIIDPHCHVEGRGRGGQPISGFLTLGLLVLDVDGRRTILLVDQPCGG